MRSAISLYSRSPSPPGSPGQLVTVMGYPMGIAGMVAKSPTVIYERLAFRHNDISAASELAALSLIRPSTTCGHLGDVVGDKLIYDAPTAHGGSGGPVFNTKGKSSASTPPTWTDSPAAQSESPSIRSVLFWNKRKRLRSSVPNPQEPLLPPCPIAGSSLLQHA